MSCRIRRNPETDVVERVERLDGEESQLYKDALKSTKDEEEALNIWAYAYTPKFVEKFGDWINNPEARNIAKNSEPSLSDVMMTFNLNSTEELLNVKDSINIHKMLSKSGLTVNSLYSVLKRAFLNEKGQFSINRSKIRATGLYLSEEISEMISYPSVRGNVKETLNKLKNSLRGDGNIFDNVPPAEIEQDHPLNINTGETNALGKFETLPIEEVENYLKNNIGDFINEENFKTKLNELDREDIRDAVLANPTSVDYVRQMVQGTGIVPVFVSRDGVLVQKNTNDTVELLRNTITVNDSKVFFTESIDDLRSIEEEDWYANPEMVTNILSLVEQKGVKAGLDLSGLVGKYTQLSQEEIVGFLDLVDDFNIKTEELTLSEEDIVEFSNDLIEFFEREVTPEFRAVPILKDYRGKTLTMIEGDINETSAYRTDGLVKAYGNLYQRVSNYNDYASAAEDVYSNLMEDVSILPREVFKTFGLKKGYYDVAAITDPINKPKVLASINAYVSMEAAGMEAEDMEDYDTNKEIALMKALFNPTKVEDEIVNTTTARKQNFTGDRAYLTTDFISDFYIRMLEEKVVNKSDLWDNALKYFTVNDMGIDMLTQSPETLSEIKLALQSQPILYNNLMNYALISKNPKLEFLQEFVADTIIDTIETRRDFVTNNPKALKKLSKDYTKLSEDTLLVKNSTDEFVKVSDGVYELVSSDNGVAQYSRLITDVNPMFYEFDLSYPIVEDVDTLSFKEPSPNTFAEDAHGISKTKLKTKEDDMSCMK